MQRASRRKRRAVRVDHRRLRIDGWRRRRAGGALARHPAEGLPNVGYGRGANVGLAAATGRYVLLLNPDTVWLEGTLAALVGALDTMPDVAAAGVLHGDGAGALKPSVMREPTVRRQLGEALALHHLPALRRLQEPIAPPAGYDETRDADWLVGAALLIRSSALEQIGGFDPRFFLYSEETDWCVRAPRRLACRPPAARDHPSRRWRRPGGFGCCAPSRRLEARLRGKALRREATSGVLHGAGCASRAARGRVRRRRPARTGVSAARPRRARLAGGVSVLRTQPRTRRRVSS